MKITTNGRSVQIENNGDTLGFVKDDVVINIECGFYVVVKPIDHIEQYPHKEDTVIVMEFDLLKGEVTGLVSDPELAHKVMCRWAEMKRAGM